jgi:hypothetical protein
MVQNSGITEDIKHLGQIFPEKNLELSGSSPAVPEHALHYQMWFTEHHPDICSIGPTERWLEHAAFLLSLDFTIEGPYYSATSGYLLREYATHAVRDYILDEICIMFGWDIKIFVLPILDAILGISKTREEGAWPRGKLVFISPDAFSKLDFLVRFPPNERPSLQKHKHVRKLLQAVEFSDRKLVSFGNHVVGIATGEMPEKRSTAHFQGDFGFVKLSGQPICSFSDGKVYSSTQKPNLVTLEEALLEFSMDASGRHELFRIVSQIVNEAGKEKHGCTLVIDLSPEPAALSGQQLENPMDLQQEHLLELAKSLAKLDGALHLRKRPSPSWVCVPSAWRHHRRGRPSAGRTLQLGAPFQRRTPQRHHRGGLFRSPGLHYSRGGRTFGPVRMATLFETNPPPPRYWRIGSKPDIVVCN